MLKDSKKRPRGFSRRKPNQPTTPSLRKKDVTLTTPAADVPNLPSSAALRRSARSEDGRCRDELVLAFAGREVPARAYRSLAKVRLRETNESPVLQPLARCFLMNGKAVVTPGSLKKSIRIQDIFRWRGLNAPGNDPTRGNHCCVYRLSHCVETPASRK